ncbi:MAG: hypothetical protein QM729_13315 [Solirubrobacterales bacterium]
MRAPRSALGLVCLLACGSVVVAGCGGGSDSTSQINKEAEAGKSRPAPAKSAFPATEGRTLGELIEDEASGHPQVKVTPSAEVFYEGANRYPFLVAEKDSATGKEGKEIDDAEVAIYYAKIPAVKPGAKSKSTNKGLAAKAQAQALEQPAVGPFPARIETLATKPAFRDGVTSASQEVAGVVYSAELNFPGDGEYRPVALIKENGRLVAKKLRSIQVGEFTKIPRPGKKAPLIQTPTKVNYADVLGKEPILLLFTTPKFCQSRVCGPVLDVARQAQHDFGGKANFIHMEIYNENDLSQLVRPQVRRFHLPTEPWLFAINREGVVSAAIEGPFGTQLMDKTVEKVVGE